MHKKIILVTYLGVVYSKLFLSVTPVRAAEQLFSDDFSSGQISNWLVQRNAQWLDPTKPCLYFGNAALWQIKDGMIGMELQSHPCVTEITPKGIDLSKLKGHEFSFDWKFSESTNMDRSALILWQDAQNWYDLKILDSSLLIQKVVQGKQYFLTNDSATYAFQANQTYHFTLSYLPDKKIEIKINGATVLTTQDVAPFISGPITVGLKAGVGAVPRSISYFDNVAISAISTNEGTQLNVPLFKQHDPQWRDDEYDNATNWSEDKTKTKMTNWGCAVTSMAMVMRYYGMHSLPDGRTLNPATLNSWLKGEKDGFLGGSINWVAATRLTKLINAKLGTPKLEYTRVKQNPVEIAKQEILAGKPTILEMPGHFLVGSGVTQDKADFYIKDPAYIYTKFSQHKSSITSARKFQPSMTDLSYLIITHAPDTEVLLKDNRGKLITGESFSETIIDPTDTTGKTSTPPLVQTHFAKPADAQYAIEVKKQTPGDYSMQVLSYDAEAKPTIITQKGNVGTTPEIFTLDYRKKGKSSLRKKFIWQPLVWLRILIRFR